MADHIEDLIPLYALDALTDEERAQVEAYVENNAQARQQLQEALAAAEALLVEADPIAPPPAVKENVLAFARRHPRAAAARPSKMPTRLSWWQRFQQSMALPAVAGAVVVVAVVLLIWNINLRQSNEALQTQLAVVRTQLLQQEEVLALLPGSQSFPVPGTESLPDAAAQLVVASDGRSAVLVARDLTVLEANQAYQVWLIDAQGPQGQGTFTAGAGGDGRLAIIAQLPITDYDAVGVSIEPAGGSEQPTGDIVLLGEIGG